MSKYDDSGILFKNDRKEKDTHPDYQGSATIDGIEYWMSSWVKKSDKGSFMTFSFKPKQQQQPIPQHQPMRQQQPRQQQPRQQQEEEFDDDTPF